MHYKRMADWREKKRMNISRRRCLGRGELSINPWIGSESKFKPWRSNPSSFFPLPTRNSLTPSVSRARYAVLPSHGNGAQINRALISFWRCTRCNCNPVPASVYQSRGFRARREKERERERGNKARLLVGRSIKTLHASLIRGG